MSLVWIFLDGVGYGENDPLYNPWTSVNHNSLISAIDKPPTYSGAAWKPLDATFGVEGIPQSATGTTALLTGIPAPQILGRHLSGFPNLALREIIRKHTIHKQIMETGHSTTFANAYNEAYFQRKMNRQSVTTHAVYAAGIPFRKMKEYRKGEAVFHDLTGELIKIQGNGDKLSVPRSVQKKVVKNIISPQDTFAAELDMKDFPVLTASEAGKRIVRISKKFDLVLFEYVKTDLAGHSQDLEWSHSIVQEVMTFLWTILDLLDLKKDTLLVTSDHGNSEDLSLKSHTKNPVPAVAVGANSHEIIDNCENIADILPSVVRVFKEAY